MVEGTVGGQAWGSTQGSCAGHRLEGGCLATAPLLSTPPSLQSASCPLLRERFHTTDKGLMIINGFLVLMTVIVATLINSLVLTWSNSDKYPRL